MEEDYLPYVAEPIEQNKQPALMKNQQNQASSDLNQQSSGSAVLSDNDENSKSPGIANSSAVIKPEPENSKEPPLNEGEVESNFLRHIIKQRSGNFPELKRRYDATQEEPSTIYDIISSNENTNRNKKLLQGSEWVSRNKMNNMLYENRVFYNGVEHKLLSRNKSKFNAYDGNVPKKQKVDEFDLNSLAHAEEILKPISSLRDIVTHPTIKKTFLNDKIFNDLEIQTTLMIEKAKLESETLNDYVSVFLGDDPTAYLEDKIKLPEYDHHIDFEKNDFKDKIYLDLEDVLKENGKDSSSSDDEEKEDVEMQDGIDQLNDKIRNSSPEEHENLDNVENEVSKIEEVHDGDKPEEGVALEPAVNVVEENEDHKEESQQNISETKPVEVITDENTETKPVEEAAGENTETKPVEEAAAKEHTPPVTTDVGIAKADSNEMHEVIEKTDDIIVPKAEDTPIVEANTGEEQPVVVETEVQPVTEETEAQPSVEQPKVIVNEEQQPEAVGTEAVPEVKDISSENPSAEQPTTDATPALEEPVDTDNDAAASVFESDDDESDPFFGLPEYEKTTLNQRLFNLAEYDPATTQQITFSRQLTQILLQRNQEYIKNMIAIRQHFFKIERIRERLVKWGYEYSGIPEEDVEVPNVLTAVKRGLISASTNRASVSGQNEDGYAESGDENDDEE